MPLNPTQIKGITDPGKYRDNNGLYLVVTRAGSKQWVQRIVIGGKRREMGLGGYPTVTLAKAREKVSINRASIAAGHDPLSDKRKARTIPTFREAALKVHQQKLARFTSEKHGKNWLQRLEKYAFPTLGDMPLDTIDRQDVLEILDPIWTTKTDTARRVREMMISVFKWGMAYGHVQINVAGEIIDAALIPPAKRENHRRAMPYQDVPATLKKIRASTSSMAAKLAMEFVILTAVRSSEVREATWGEIDLESRVWTIPAYRMKSRTFQHRVPLSDAAIAVLDAAKGIREGELVFPSPVKANTSMSDATLMKLLKINGLDKANQRSWLPDKFQDVGAVDARRGCPGLRGIGPGPQDRE